MRVGKTGVLLLMGILVLALAACSGVDTAAEAEGTDAPAIGESPVSPGEELPGDETGGFDQFVQNLTAQGLTVEPAGEVTQPFFPVNGQLVMVNGANIQVFEFADEAARSAVSETISESGDTIGTTTAEWVDTPNFWAQGRLIVLYVGQDQTVIDAISQVMGEPITASPGGAEGEPETELPEAVLEVQRALAEQMSAAVEQVEIVNVEQTEWSDACLGLAQEGEMCAQVITPGWLITLIVNGEEIEVHTDELGQVIRWQGPEGEINTFGGEIE